MSETARGAGTADETPAVTYVEAAFDADTEWPRIEQAVADLDVATAEDLIREATLELVDDVVDGVGLLECPHDDCERTFPSRRKLRGHLGSSEHALDVPDGEFWCGYCGYGPTSWRGVNAHHGSSDHDGDTVRLDEEPDREDLIAPDDVPDHKNPELLEELYQRHDGNYTSMCRAHDFDVSPGRVRHYLIEFGIHEVTPQGPTEDEDGPVYRDRDWLQERYEAVDGNVSEMHRRLEDEDVDVPYRTLLKNLKRFDIHDPTESPAQTRGLTSSDTDDEPDDEATADAGDDPVDEEPEPPELAPEPAPAEDDEVDFLAVDGPEDVESFDDILTPDWLDEHSFYTAAEMSTDVDELVAALGWDDRERLEQIVQLLDVDVAIDGFQRETEALFEEIDELEAALEDTGGRDD